MALTMNTMLLDRRPFSRTCTTYLRYGCSVGLKRLSSRSMSQERCTSLQLATAARDILPLMARHVVRVNSSGGRSAAISKALHALSRGGVAGELPRTSIYSLSYPPQRKGGYLVNKRISLGLESDQFSACGRPASTFRRIRRRDYQVV
jgi:hypothetical protein